MKKPFWEDDDINLPIIEEQLESPATPQPQTNTVSPYNPNIFTPVTPFTDYQLLRRTTTSKFTAPSLQLPAYPGVDHLYKGKMRDSLFGGSIVTPLHSPSPWDITLRGPHIDPDTTYRSTMIQKDLPPHLSKHTPLEKPPGIQAATTQPTPRDFYLFPS